MEYFNTFSIKDRKIMLNGTHIRHVTDFQIKNIPGNMSVNVTLSFDVPMENLVVDYEHGEKITIPVNIGGQQIGSVTVTPGK